MAVTKINGNEQAGAEANGAGAATDKAGAGANPAGAATDKAGAGANPANGVTGPQANTEPGTQKTSSVRHANESDKRGPDKQEYLNARKRVKGGIKIGIIVLVVIVLACIGGCVFAAVNPTPAGKVKVSVSSSKLVGEYYQDVKTILEKDGFTNIELRPEGDLIAGILHDEGDVETVSIDGKTSFSSGTTYDADAKVVISYHSYPEKSSSNTSNTSNASSASNASNTSNASAASASNASSNASSGTSTASNANSSASSAATDSATFRKSVDDYEAFIDQYVEFMQKYKSDSANTASMMADYAKMLAQYEKLSKEMDSVDESKLTADDDAYYLAALQRCNEKLASVAA